MYHDQSEQERDQLETARGCAKHFLQPYIIDGWTLKALNAKPLRIDRQEYSARTGPGEVQDHQGAPRKLSKGDIAITRIGERPECAIYHIEEFKAGIHDEARGYRQKTLAEVYHDLDEEEQRRTQQPEAEPARKKRRAPYRMYQGGYCENPACGEPLGLIEVEGGRARHYCDNNGKCRVAAHRARKSEAKRAAILQYNSELRDFWYENRIEGELLRVLQEILIHHGKGAAYAATRAVLFAQREQVRIMGLAQQYRPEPPRPPRT